MKYYVRAIELSNWQNEKFNFRFNLLRLSPDSITCDLHTNDKKISFWEIEKKGELTINDMASVSAAIQMNNKNDTIRSKYLIFFTENDLLSYYDAAKSRQPGDTLIEPMIDKHVDMFINNNFALLRLSYLFYKKIRQKQYKIIETTDTVGMIEYYHDNDQINDRAIRKDLIQSINDIKGIVFFKKKRK